jgi:hypothetical protein
VVLLEGGGLDAGETDLADSSDLVEVHRHLQMQIDFGLNDSGQRLGQQGINLVLVKAAYSLILFQPFVRLHDIQALEFIRVEAKNQGLFESN